MKEFKFTGTMRPERVLPDAKYREPYQEFRKNLLLLMENPKVEVILRVHDPRQDWIDEWYAAATVAEMSGEIFVKFCKDATFVCAYGTASHQDIACAAPRHGDKYDQHTGIAVAYAKFCDAEIPDYI